MNDEQDIMTEWKGAAFKRKQYQSDNAEMWFVDVLSVWNQLAPHMGGWKITRKPNELDAYSGNVVHWLQLERDGFRIYVKACTRSIEGPGKEPCIYVCVGGYQYPGSGQQIDMRWHRDRLQMNKTPSARINIGKKTAKQVAAEILRRVITPGLPLVASLNAAIAEAQTKHDARKAAIAAFANDGMQVSERSETEAVVYGTGWIGHVESSGTVRLEYLYIDAADVKAFEKFMASRVKRWW